MNSTMNSEYSERFVGAFNQGLQLLRNPSVWTSFRSITFPSIPSPNQPTDGDRPRPEHGNSWLPGFPNLLAPSTQAIPSDKWILAVDIEEMTSRC